MQIIFVRHGKPDYRLADTRKMSQLEKDYSPLSRDTIPFLIEQSQHPCFKGAEIIISSPYTRALQTAEILNRQLQLELFVEHDLREWRADKLGAYISLSERDLRWSEYRKLLHAKQPMIDKPYETIQTLSKRVKNSLLPYKHHHKIVVVSHFNVLKSLIGYQQVGIECGGIIELNFNITI